MTAMEFWHAVARKGGERFKKAVPGLAAGLVLVLLQTPSETLAHSYKLDDIAVGHVWASPPEEGAGGIAVYGPLLNRGGKSARLDQNDLRDFALRRHLPPWCADPRGVSQSRQR